MSIHPYPLVAAKALAAVIASAGAVAISYLAGIYAVALCAGSVEGVAMVGIFALVALPVLVGIGVGLRRVSWSLRVAFGVVFLAASFLLMPRLACAATPLTSVEC